MCGICGLISKETNGFYHPDVSLFTQMLIADSLRGTDGTGVFGVYGTGSVQWLKVGSHPFALVNNKKYDSFTSAMVRKFKMVVGHNRKLTAGAKSNENSHPFIHEHIILVHNGTIHGHKKLADTEVDSHAIAHAIANKGYKEALKELDGAFALVWFNMKTRTLHLVRNDERPLFIVETDSQIAFASEGYMLNWIGERNGKNWKGIKSINAGLVLSISQDTSEIKTEAVSFRVPETITYSQYMGEGYSPAWKEPPPSNEELHEAMENLSGSVEELKSTIVDTEDDAAIEAAILADCPEMDADEWADASAFMNTYIDGKQILFEPKGLTSLIIKGQVEGHKLVGTLRGDPTVEVLVHFDKTRTYLECNALANSKVLKGTIYGTMLNPTTYKKSLHVNNVMTLQMYTTFNGRNITSSEWIELCDKHKCTGCSSRVLIQDVTRTSVNFKETGLRFFCKECVKKYMDTLPPEQRKSLEETNVVLNTTEKDWDMHGAAHGS